MKLLYYCAMLLLSFTSCKHSLNVFKNGKKQGKWIIRSSDGDYSVEKYRHDLEYGTSKQFFDHKLYRTERHKGHRSYIKFYHLNGKVSSKGWSVATENASRLRWYYTGLWKYYDEGGKLVELRVYDKGKAINEYFPLQAANH